jgi:hypothetical protein
MDTLINRHGTKIYGALTSFFGTARVEVARAMETAIKADPPKEGA